MIGIGVGHMRRHQLFRFPEGAGMIAEPILVVPRVAQIHVGAENFIPLPPIGDGGGAALGMRAWRPDRARRSCGQRRPRT